MRWYVLGWGMRVMVTWNVKLLERAAIRVHRQHSARYLLQLLLSLLDLPAPLLRIGTRLVKDSEVQHHVVFVCLTMVVGEPSSFLPAEGKRGLSVELSMSPVKLLEGGGSRYES